MRIKWIYIKCNRKEGIEMENRIEQEMEYYKLTHTQKREWNTEKRDPNTPMENIGGVVIIKGEVNIELLEKAIQIFIERNDGIRLRFIERDGESCQYIFPYQLKKIDYIDFSNSINPQEESEKWSNQTFRTAFNLEDSDLYYLGLFRISDKESGILLKIHHIICDGWGTSVIQTEILQTYCRLMKNEPVNTDPAPSYIDFIEKEDKYLNSSGFIKDKEYWNGKFSNIFDISEEFLYNSTHETEGRRSIFNLDYKLSMKIKEFLAEKKISTNTFFLIVMGLYLNKKTQKEDIIIGNPIFNRMTKKDRATLGMYISIMPVQLNIDKEKIISDLINEVTSGIRRDLYHQRYPYDELVKNLEISKRGYTSLHKYSINCYNTNYLDNVGDDNTLELREYYNGHQNCSLRFIVKEVKDNKLTLYIDHRISEYTEEEINDMYEYMMYVILQIIDNSDKKLKEILN